MSGVPVDPANEDTFRSWDGPGGEYWATNAATFDESMAAYLPPLFAAANVSLGERVLDIGCGNGVTTLEAARRSAPARAMGLDLSASMLEVARHRATEQRTANVEFIQGDAQVYPFEPGGFDVVISRAGVMFFADPAAAFANIGRGVRSGGRLALMVWQGIEVNEWMTAVAAALAAGRTLPTPPPGAPGPSSLGNPDRVRQLLGDAGFGGVDLTGVVEPMRFGPDTGSAYEFVFGLSFVGALLKDLDEPTRADALAELRSVVEAHLTPAGVQFGAAAWIVTAART
ncbi:class I SAM-dependent methyltransferase [Sporichthya sp.]|uniref:class I SAM-dependent methyltransferase n=1 Tax=Sporichthya sp. TaxID=65475 RepID=UPI0025D34A28|nr:class I SAM-dependent methyltransferase [Sporichthya sp.]